MRHTKRKSPNPPLLSEELRLLIKQCIARLSRQELERRAAKWRTMNPIDTLKGRQDTLRALVKSRIGLRSRSYVHPLPMLPNDIRHKR